MKPERTLLAERPLARHCPELLRGAPARADVEAQLARFAPRLARALAAGLRRLTGGDEPQVEARPARECVMADLAGEVAPLAANSLFALGEERLPLLATMPADAVLRLLDRAFGGRGEPPSPLPAAFPLSAELMIDRLETLVAAAIAEASGALEDQWLVSPQRRDGSLEQLAPFPDDTRLNLLTLRIEEAGREAWSMALAFPLATLAEMFAPTARPPARNRQDGSNPIEPPFDGLPLTVSAVLVDMRVPVAALTGLRVGQILPVAVARKVPLRIGERTIAHGSAGALDDRVAIQLTDAF